MSKQWLLEGYIGDSDRIQRVAITQFPCIVGRVNESGFPVPKGDVSRKHAEIIVSGDALVVNDLGSTNGTFVNRNRISSPTTVDHGDVLHFGSNEYRLIAEGGVDTEEEGEETTTFAAVENLSDRLPTGLRELQQMIDQRAVTAHFQAITRVTGTPVAYEILGRGAFDALPPAPWPLFQIAESGGLDVALSELFRDIGIQEAVAQAPGATIFVNTHPAELKDMRRLMMGLEKTMSTLRPHKLVLEIHEDGVSNLKAMQALHMDLKALNIGLAYDDFGAGQSRLQEMVDVPPDYVKFDMSLIRDIDTATAAKREMIQSLVTFSKNTGIITLAEGVETQAELDTCADMGFELIQGWIFGKPKPNIYD